MSGIYSRDGLVFLELPVTVGLPRKGASLEAVKAYLRRMQEIRGTGGATKETSYYSALENLLNELGKSLKPKVICNGQLRNQGAGHPDFGLYTRNQCSSGEPKAGQGAIPERGVIEVKPLADKNWQTAQGKQVTKYFDRYRLVLITNYREFRLIGEDETGNPVQREFLSLVDDEAAFWQMAQNPNVLADDEAAYFGEFLKRVMMNAAPLTRPEDVAWFLASYARDALTTLNGKDASALEPLKSALETALGIKFEGEKGEHFFLSTLVQTLFYGIFSAWVLWARGTATGRFDWRSAGYHLTVPMIRTLFEEIAKPTKLTPLGIIDILDRTGDALNRVDRTTFFKNFATGNAVQHFYEPFLEAFDPELRKELGVWYTPPEIVSYMVERVDQVLRQELGIAAGLADEQVYVLDPCCGTGAFLIEVLRKIEETLRAQNDDELIGEDIKKAVRNRIFGFEILPSPFVVAHWQVGDLLDRLKAPLDASNNERPAVYLTNALTGWEPNGAKVSLPLFPELAQERDQAEHVKRDAAILVVLGNPPYNGFAGSSPDEENGLVEPYKDGLRDRWGIEKFNLDDLYVRFLRIAERRIAELGRGIVCYISNYSYLGDPSFVVAREKHLSEFDDIWIDSLNGDSRETGKRTPEGAPDPSVFSTKFNRAGIRLGTAVGLFVKHATGSPAVRVRFRDFWGQNKRAELLASLDNPGAGPAYAETNPQVWNKLSFRPLNVSPAYLSWPRLEELASEEPFNGLMEKRGGSLIDIDREQLASRMTVYFNPSEDLAAAKSAAPQLMKNAARFDAVKAREKALAQASFDDSRIVRYIVRPFDVRYAYYTEIRPVWNECRPELWAQYSSGNKFLMSRPARVASPEGIPVHFTRCLGDNDALKGHAYYFPFTIETAAHGMLSASTKANLSKAARDYLTALNLPNADQQPEVGATLWLHALAICHSPAYLTENKDGLSIDWPRLPMPASITTLQQSKALGAAIEQLLDTETAVDGVTTGTISEHLKPLGAIAGSHLEITAGWGSRDKAGKVNPGLGRVDSRAWTDPELEALRAALDASGHDVDEALRLLGPPVDVYLNEKTFWRAVPQSVWDYTVGGYQMIKKWLSYRENAVLGRSITPAEAREVTAMVRRLTALVLLTKKLDENYRSCSQETYSWPTATGDPLAPTLKARLKMT